MLFSELKEIDQKFVLPTYTRQDLCFVKGEGVWVEDISGKRYMDMFPGWAVSGLGHCHPRVVSRIKDQAERILHVSNNYYNELQPLLAEKIVQYSFPGKVFFANSGAEANEAAIKFARKWAGPGRHEIITMEKSFHGRTMATLSATGQDKVKKGYEPLLEGFSHVPFNDINAVEEAFTDKTCAVMVEPVQGEGGVNVPDADYLKELKALTESKNALLIFDEVQTGIGRCGKMFAHEIFGVEPDLMTLAKSLGGGLPIGALVATGKYADVFSAGSHASTFGGSPIACAAALGVFEAIEKDELLDNVSRMSAYIVGKIEELRESMPKIGNIRSLGLMIGVEMNMPDASELVKECAEEGLLINCTQQNVLRIYPPVTVTEENIDQALDMLANALERI